MGNGNETKMINISEKDLLDIFAAETSEAINVMKGEDKNTEFSVTMILFMATFSAGVMKRIEEKMGYKSKKEENLDYEPYHYSERGDK